MNRWFIVAGCWLMVLITMPAAYANEVKEVEANGVKAWVIEDNFLPIISINIAFRGAGYAHDPKGKDGLAYFVSGMLNEGAGNYSSQQFQKEIEENAIGFSPDVDADNFYLSLKTLSENLDKTLELANLSLTDAKFGEEETARVKSQIITFLKKSDEDPQIVAGRKFAKTVYGSHPYSQSEAGEMVTVSRITPRDLGEYAALNFATDNIVISIVGDVDDAKVKYIIEKLTEGLPDKSSTSKVPDFDAYPEAKDLKFTMKNPQTYVIFGQQGIDRLDPDYYAAYVLTYILGGDGFQARLTKQVREKEGLAYYVGTALRNSAHSNMLAGVVSTRNDSVDRSVEIIREEFRKLAENGVDEQELQDAKSYLIGSFGLNLDKNEKLAAYLLSMQIQGLTKDYLQMRNQYIESVTLEEVNKVSKWLIKPASLVFVRVGM